MFSSADGCANCLLRQRGGHGAIPWQGNTDWTCSASLYSVRPFHERKAQWLDQPRSTNQQRRKKQQQNGPFTLMVQELLPVVALTDCSLATATYVKFFLGITGSQE